MKRLGLVALLLAAAGTVAAFDLGAAGPAKPVAHTTPPPPDPAVLRQGGDTILGAVPITLPVFDLIGTTAGYNDDYDEVCPYPGSTSPDVVYTFTPECNMVLIFDMLGSSYDTKIYVYDQNLTLIGCNDDFYPDYTSRLEVAVIGGVHYFLVIDGYGGDFGDYVLSNVCLPPVLDCPPGAVLEGEPPLVDDYVDTWNGGCNTDPENPPFLPFTGPIFCGVSGWYLFEGTSYRDTDWFTLTIPETGYVDIHGDAEQQSYLFELGPLDCNTVGVLQSVTIGPFVEGTLTLIGEVGSEAWLWVGPQTFTPPGGPDDNEYDYVLHTNLTPIATAISSWSSVRALFD